jgi:hypothetical protein
MRTKPWQVIANAYLLTVLGAACGRDPAQVETVAANNAPALPLSFREADRATQDELPVNQIESILGAEGSLSEGILQISLARSDIGVVAGPRGVEFSPAFSIHGDVWFQPSADGRALLNGDMALLPEEINPFLAALLQHGLTVQAYHQHMPMLEPQVWFVHFRGFGAPEDLANRLRAALDVTALPLPQQAPAEPTTPLDPDRLANILGGEAEVGDEGVVTVTVPRDNVELLGGLRVSPRAGISTQVEFKPLPEGGAAVVPDFSMRADAINPVLAHMLGDLDWFQGCLYNQETDEHPQLYFDHMLKVGDPYALATQIREGLDQTAAK